MTPELKAKIDEAIKMAEDENSFSITLVLHTMMGCELMGKGRDFALYSQDYSKKMLVELDAMVRNQNAIKN